MKIEIEADEADGFEPTGEFRSAREGELMTIRIKDWYLKDHIAYGHILHSWLGTGALVAMQSIVSESIQSGLDVVSTTCVREKYQQHIPAPLMLGFVEEAAE